MRASFLELKKVVGKLMTDAISDTLTQIRNAQAVGHPFVSIPFSKLRFSLVNILAEEKFIKNVSKKESDSRQQIEITLLYKDSRNMIPKIKGLKRISKPGKREYIGSKKIRSVLGGRGINIISTSKGLITGKKAKKQNIGGELLCKIW